jgi:hypothetical protein
MSLSPSPYCVPPYLWMYPSPSPKCVSLLLPTMSHSFS